jgi:hypothetical protein
LYIDIVEYLYNTDGAGRRFGYPPTLAAIQWFLTFRRLNPASISFFVCIYLYFFYIIFYLFIFIHNKWQVNITEREKDSFSFSLFSTFLFFPHSTLCCVYSVDAGF